MTPGSEDLSCLSVLGAVWPVRPVLSGAGIDQVRLIPGLRRESITDGCLWDVGGVHPPGAAVQSLYQESPQGRRGLDSRGGGGLSSCQQDTHPSPNPAGCRPDTTIPAGRDCHSTGPQPGRRRAPSGSGPAVGGAESRHSLLEQQLAATDTALQACKAIVTQSEVW